MSDAARHWQSWALVRWLVGVLLAVPGLIVWAGTMVVSEYKDTFPSEPPLVRTEASKVIALFSVIAAGILIAAAVTVLIGKANRNGWTTAAFAGMTLLVAALALARAAWIHFILLA